MSIKKLLAVLAVALLAVSLIPFSAFAQEGDGWDVVYRVEDHVGVISDRDIINLNEHAESLFVETDFDFAAVVYRSVDLEGGTDADLVNTFYRSRNLGCGQNHDGIVLGLNTDDFTFVMISYGRGTIVFDESELKLLSAGVLQGYSSLGWVTAIQRFLEHSSLMLSRSDVPYVFETESYAEDTCVFGPEDVTGYSMPDWFPANISEWTFTAADENAPRVRDDADLFTDAEEAQLEERIRSIAPKYQADIVVFTDVSSYGMEHSVYAADYYDFGGFGYGPAHDGFCLFICMDPADRGGWTCVTGSPRGLYTESNAEALDDVLYDEYLSRGAYFDGVYDWIGNIGTLLDKGVPFAPPWFPSINEHRERTHDASAPRVVDDSGVLTADQIAALTEKAAQLSEKYGVDVVIHTAPSDYNFGADYYTDAFYNVKGYGFGDGYDGIVLTLFTDGENGACVLPYGSGSKNMSERNLSKLTSNVEALALSGSWYGAAERWLNSVDSVYKTGRVPWTPIGVAIRGFFSAIVSGISAAVSSGKAKRSMVTVQHAYSANDYLKRDSLRFDAGGDTLINTSVSRVYSPMVTESGKTSSSSGGHSSHSSSYHGHSGTSHSGSGRKF